LLLTFTLTAAAESKPADQKWLDAVQKMVAKGERQVSTPSTERVNLLKTWGKENGYSVKVTKTETGYRIEVTKQLAQK
jgi:hypothetical protein